MDDSKADELASWRKKARAEPPTREAAEWAAQRIKVLMGQGATNRNAVRVVMREAALKPWLKGEG